MRICTTSQYIRLCLFVMLIAWQRASMKRIETRPCVEPPRNGFGGRLRRWLQFNGYLLARHQRLGWNADLDREVFERMTEPLRSRKGNNHEGV